MKPPITVVINTYNEEANLRPCLECVRWADEIIVVDMHSTDRTAQIAREYTDKVLMHENVGYCEPARQFGIDQASNDWVFVVDADEYVPAALRRRVVEILEQENWDVVLIPRRTYFFGLPFKGAGCAPAQDMLPRVFRKSVLSWPTTVHALPEIPDRTRVYRLTDTSCAIEHLSWTSVQDYLSRLAYCAGVEAKDRVEAGVVTGRGRLGWLMAREFAWRWLRKAGWKDGLRGLALSAVLAGYQAMVALNEEVMRRCGTEDPDSRVRADYDTLVESLADEHRRLDKLSSDTPECVEPQASPTCSLCGEVGEYLHRGMVDRHYGADGKWDIRYCAKCGTAWPDPMPGQDEAAGHYVDYYTHAPNKIRRGILGRAMRAAERAYLQRHYGCKLGTAKGLDWLQSGLVYLHPSGSSRAECAAGYLKAPQPGQRLLDIGCGDGALADGLRELGWEVECIDTDPAAVDVAAFRGLSVRVGDISEQKYPEGHFNALIAKHVVEHVRDPQSFLGECRRILKPGGRAVIITPNLRSLGHRLFGPDWLHLDPPRHLNLWEADSLKKAAEDQGLVCERLFTSPRCADDVWGRSCDIRKCGRADLGRGLEMSKRIRGAAFALRERCSILLGNDCGEEIVMIAVRPEKDGVR